MKIVIEFYRTRNADDAHAIVGRETKEAVNTSDAIELAQQLSQTLDMPQRPDAMTTRPARPSIPASSMRKLPMKKGDNHEPVKATESNCDEMLSQSRSGVDLRRSAQDLFSLPAGN
ncbi:hypothetical protein [Allomesorhizobium alhagi]|jgi:hypothetical protein|uniref:Uncharacterized protein n=1 Tax=Mesorhizobium alhagi CCNWXJ12-2 TaxID=1107882 RepID=H0I0R7_9HYPH|nr:hypothetical protein [Mesorhizobium alhagi]EHK53429.1 hypothetical protein MAXJ12_30272 [Mesorhizobium alhagi CCNWXJ12-2]